jgi:hypothetical protein
MPCIPFISRHGAAAIITRNSPSSVHRPSIVVGLHWQCTKRPSTPPSQSTSHPLRRGQEPAEQHTCSSTSKGTLHRGHHQLHIVTLNSSSDSPSPRTTRDAGDDVAVHARPLRHRLLPLRRPRLYHCKAPHCSLDWISANLFLIVRYRSKGLHYCTMSIDRCVLCQTASSFTYKIFKISYLSI